MRNIFYIFRNNKRHISIKHLFSQSYDPQEKFIWIPKENLFKDAYCDVYKRLLFIFKLLRNI